MNLTAFVAKWSQATLTERSAAQQHFLDLCDVLGVPKPAQADPTGERYAFEKGVTKSGGGKGFADVWLRAHFAWEYKGKKKNLTDAYAQLLQYAEALENPPLLVVCDLNRFEVHTRFTGLVKTVYAFDLSALGANVPTPTCALPPLDVLRALFDQPERLRPRQTTEEATREVAVEFGKIADHLRARKVDPKDAARFLIRLLFCLFAEDVGLLPPGLFQTLARASRADPPKFARQLRSLFQTMATGGEFGLDDIKHFNGGLFADDAVVDLNAYEIGLLSFAAQKNWANIEPSIFGTLFERGLDPAKRAQLGAHFTSEADIRLLVEPVLMAPLRRRWEEVKAEAEALFARLDQARQAVAASPMPPTPAERAAVTRAEQQLSSVLGRFGEEVARVRVLDPACGSGNFLYVALRLLLDLEKEVIATATGYGLTGFAPQVGPEQLRGIEVSEYAHELAGVTVLIGYIQWRRDNGFGSPPEPILKNLTGLVNRDAVLGEGEDGKPAEPEWPDADVIVGNPPFLGDKRMRAELGDEYVERLRRLYAGRVPGGADFVTYWFERARALIEAGKVKRAGLLATNSIRSGANRRVLEKVKASGDIFLAWADRPWVLDGAAVRVSMVGFDNGAEQTRERDGQPVAVINADLTAAMDVTAARVLPENAGLCFLGMMKGGPFDLDAATGQAMLAAPINPNGRPNADVVRQRLGGQDITGRPRGGYVIDFADLPEHEAALYEQPFEYVRRVVKPVRDASRDAGMRTNWWLHGRSRPALRAAIAGLRRCIVTPEVAKHRLFVWMDTATVPDHKLHVFRREDDYFFGVLHSRLHELWSLAQCSWMGVGNDPSYSSSRTFGTFPLPWPPGSEPEGDARVKAIGDAARRLVTLRDNWLNPPGASDADLKKRTLTNLYNARPTWLANAHAVLDKAVFAAYNWPDALSDAEVLERLLALNTERANGPT